MTKVLVALVGHQPLPLLLAIRHIKPNKVIFLCSNDTAIKQRKDNLIRLLPVGITTIEPGTSVDPWHKRQFNLEDLMMTVQYLKGMCESGLKC